LVVAVAPAAGFAVAVGGFESAGFESVGTAALVVAGFESVGAFESVGTAALGFTATLTVLQTVLLLTFVHTFLVVNFVAADADGALIGAAKARAAIVPRAKRMRCLRGFVMAYNVTGVQVPLPKAHLPGAQGARFSQETLSLRRNLRRRQPVSRTTVKIAAVKRRVVDNKGLIRRGNPVLLPSVFVFCGVIVTWAFLWGRRFERREPRIKLGAAPFVGEWDVRVSPAIIPAILLSGLAVWCLPKALRVLSDKTSILVCSVVGAGFALVLAAADGLSAVLAPVVDPTEYWANVEFLPPAGDLLLLHSNYDFLVDRTVHMKGHPPGFILILKGLAAIGLGTPWIVGALSFLGIAMIISAVAVAVRSVVDGATMRLFLPFLALAPFAVWLGTSADAFFSGVAAWGITSLTVAVRSPSPRWRLLLGSFGGLLLSGALFLTYGAATILALAAVMVLTGLRSRLIPTIQVGAAACLNAGLVTAVFDYFGFWWFDGLRLTNKFYWIGSAYFRTWTYFLLANVAVLLIAVGPAVIAGVASLRDHRLWPLVGGALLCITVAEVSQYSKGEVERIWLLFMPWLVPAVAALAHSRPNGVAVNEQSTPASPVVSSINPWWLVGQVAVAFALQMTLRSKW
jgi:methylthioxylose transferase